MDPHTGGSEEHQPDPFELPELPELPRRGEEPTGGAPASPNDPSSTTGSSTSGPSSSGLPASGRPSSGPRDSWPSASGLPKSVPPTFPTSGLPKSGLPKSGAPSASETTGSLPVLRQTPPVAARVERPVDIVAGDFLLTINTVDGSEVTRCPDGIRPRPERLSREQRELARRSEQAPPLAGRPGPQMPLLERDEERDRLVRLLSRGRSVRVTGPSGSGRTSLLADVADSCARVAPDGVIHLSGYRRTPRDLLHSLYAAVHRAPGYRPDRARLLGYLGDVGAVVVVDDVEFGGAALDDLIASAPECAFLIAATPDVPSPSPESPIEEVFLSGLSRVACLELLEHSVDRLLEDEEAAWAADLWFESEGLPLRFVQAGALLRQRDAHRTRLAEDLEACERSPFDADEAEEGADDTPFTPPAAAVPLPSLAESAAPAARLAGELTEAGRETLRFAVALGGECPNAGHLPALVGDTHGDTALAELVARGLAVPVAGHYRLAAGVRTQLIGLEPPGDHALTAARHFAWWSGHRSVTVERVAAESEALLAAMAAARDQGHHSAAVLLARSAAPAFAAALHWSAWERALRIGQEAARLAGEVAQEAYFHHELGVLALCTNNSDRARAELEASIALRGALADRTGTAVGRRTLALVSERPPVPDPEPVPPGGRPPGGPRSQIVTAALPSLPTGPQAGHGADTGATTVISPRPTPRGANRPAAVGARRNLVAAGAGLLLAAVLGTVVTLGSVSGAGDETKTPMKVAPVESQTATDTDDTVPAPDPAKPSPAPSRSGSESPAGPSGQPTVRPPMGNPGGGLPHQNGPTPRPTKSHGDGSSSSSPSKSPKPKPSGSSSKPSDDQSPTPPTSPSPSPSPTTGQPQPPHNSASGSASPSGSGATQSSAPPVA
ncbi:ATP-binding protein [Wenjunlia tyrosinilytica]|uniref:ATPase AAA n=1 Tax=Wenjunlia tyrosinilytica TaxID=1544741 RepID=A0A917ZT84_9ACTN|nr:ATP-binding protein [Wenjunlia tyrosinilytica]GGO92736.1 ATPase AAA [Wenjunlia tyrosinilytica]